MNRKTILMSPADSNISNFFEKQFNVIYSECINDYITFEQYHADMQVLNLNGTLFIDSRCLNLRTKLNNLEYDYILCDNIGNKYPENVALNAALVGNKLLCNEKALHHNVKNYCKNNNINIINVKQGYAKCSVIVIDNNTIITDDESIAKAAIKNRIEVLKIEKGDIHLNNNNVGFIGGASAIIGDTVYFFGDIMMHRNADKISEFLCKHNKYFKSVARSNLIDIGGIVNLD